jgi:hypothetical protein
MRWHCNPGVLRALFLVGATAAFVAYDTDPPGPTAAGTTAVSNGDQIAPLAADGSPGRDAEQAIVDVCHSTAGGRHFIRLSVASAAVDAHLNHGDGLVGGPVLQQPGMKFDASCRTVALTRATITFAGLAGDGSPFVTYTESGLSVVSKEGSWQVSTSYGNPSPFIQFLRPAGAPTLTAAITLTAGGADFAFTSVDLYSSVTPIPYVFTGLRGFTTLFTSAGTQPQTFGNFATVLNPYSTVFIDTLAIGLANPSDECCSNPVGLDNIVIVY